MKEFFKKSKNQQGYIYICSVDYQTITRNGEIIEEGTKYKYGKTRDIEKRMSMYGAAYKLIIRWKVNHMSLREELIRNNENIYSDRHESLKDARDEHVNYNCFGTVEWYATAEIILKGNSIIVKDLYGNEETRPLEFIKNILHL